MTSKSDCARSSGTPGRNRTIVWSQWFVRESSALPDITAGCIIIGTQRSIERNGSLPRKAGVGDADDRERVAVERHDAAEDPGIAAEVPLPELVAEHDDGIRIRRAIFFRPERAAERRANAEHVEVVAGDDLAPHAHRVVRRPQAHREHVIADGIGPPAGRRAR